MESKNTLKGTFGKYISEIFVIFLGISISFWFDEWRNNRKDRETELKILMNMRENLVQDTLMMGHQIKVGDNLVYGITQLLSLKGNIDPDSLNKFIDNATSYLVCFNNQTTYEEIRQTGLSSLIQNDTLKKAILGHYTVLVPYIKEWCEIDKSQTMTQLIPEMSNYLPVVIDSLNIVSASEKKAAIKIPKVKNLLLTGLTYKKETMRIFGTVHSNTKKLIEKIDKTLNK